MIFNKLEKKGIILKIGSINDFDSGMVESPAIWFDLKRKKYGMVYVGYKLIKEKFTGYNSVAFPKIGLAWSEDLLTWEKDIHNPIFAPSITNPFSYDSFGTSAPFIFYENNKYYLFYFGLTEKGYEAGYKTLNLAISEDLLNWKRYKKNPIITPYGNGFRRDAIWHPNVIKHNSIYYLFFNSSGVYNSIEEEFIGYAKSTNLLDWEIDDKNSPILVGSFKNTAWDSSGRAGDPCVFRYNNKWYMAYYSWDKVHTQDGIAWTTDEEFPLGWRPFENNPILKVGKEGSFDELHAGKPFIIIKDKMYYHFYTAVDRTQKREIALAIGKLE